jgi:hypothetical protein
MFFKPISWSPTRVNWAIVKMNHKSFPMRCPSSRKNRLFEWNKYICHKVASVHFGIIWKSAYNIEAGRIPYNRIHELFALNIESWFYDHIISWQNSHPTWWSIEKDKNSSPVTRWCQPSRWAVYRNDNIALTCSFRFWRKQSVNRCGTRRKWNDLMPIDTCKCFNTVPWPIRSLSAIEKADSKGDLSSIAKILVSRSSRGDLPVQIASWRSWRPNVASAI